MTRADVAKLIGIIKARYPRAEWGPDDALTVEAWHMSLGDLPLEPVTTALRSLFEQSPFPPDPVDVRSWLLAKSGVAPDPADAWQTARAAIAAYYPGHPFRFEMPETVRQAINAIGGLHTLKMSETPAADREAFLRAYATYRKRAMADVGLGFAAVESGAVELRAVPGQATS